MRKIVLLAFASLIGISTVFAQRTISGQVKDANGSPIPNVSITIKNSNTGTVSGSDGTYKLTLPEAATTLVFSAVDFESVEAEIGQSNSINITMNAADRSLQEVVVVAYGTQKKLALTGAQSQIAPEKLQTLVSPSVDKQLAGRAAGVQVTNSSGLVNQAPRIRIRGVNSINQNRDPLIVLDGVPTFSGGYSSYANTNALADINPADIESIDVLKDGAATAIYGSRAANGVILITTKKGKNGRSNVTYNTTIGLSKPRQRFSLLNANEFVTIANEKLTNAGLPEGAFLNSENTNTDWQDVVFRDQALAQLHSLGIDGGNDKTTFYLSFNYANLEGMIVTNMAKRYGVRANIEHKVNNWLKVGNNLTISRTDDNDQNNGGNALSGAVANALRALPNVRALDPTNTAFGGYNIKPDGSALGRDANTRDIENNYTNIAFVLNNNKFSSIKYRIINNAFAEIRPLSFLTYRLQASVDYNSGNDFQGLDPRHGDGRSSGGIVTNQSLSRSRYVIQNLLNFNKDFGDHSVGVVLGNEIQRDESSSFFGQGTNVSDVFFLSNNIISNSFVNQFSGGGYSKSGFASYFGRVNYAFRQKYFIQGSLRRDGQSSLAEENRFGTFPGASIGWRISEESFWAGSNLNKVFNEFKIRGGYAEVGNTLGGFPYLSTYGSAQYGGLNGIAVNLVGNTALRWETNRKINIGADINLLNDRFAIVFDWFRNENNNLVLNAPLPVSFGIPGNAVARNIGDMENSGIELTLSGTILRAGDFNWDFNFNYTKTKNRVKTLYLNQDVFGSYNILRVGEPINALFGYQYAGVNSGNGNPMYLKADGTLIQGNIANSSYFTVVKPDDGALGDPTTLSADDRTILGNAIPTYFGGLSNTFSYKGFTVDVLFRYSGGNYIFNQTAQESLFAQGFLNNGSVILDRWTTPGQVTNVPRVWYGRDNFINLNQNANSRFVEKGDYIRLDNIMLSYTLDRSLIQRVSGNSVKSLRVFIQGQNLWVSTQYTGIDPDNISEAGIDYNVSPQARTISFGLSLGL